MAAVRKGDTTEKFNGVLERTNDLYRVTLYQAIEIGQSSAVIPINPQFAADIKNKLTTYKWSLLKLKNKIA